MFGEQAWNWEIDGVEWAPFHVPGLEVGRTAMARNKNVLLLIPLDELIISADLFRTSRTHSGLSQAGDSRFTT